MKKILIRITLFILAATFIYMGIQSDKKLSGDLPSETAQGEVSIGGDFTLTSHKGEIVSNESLNGAPRLVFFGFTHCPMICPTGMATMNVAVEELGAEAPKAIFITIDPERDTVEQLATYLENFPNVLGLTGSKEQVKQAVKAYRVYAQKMPAEDAEAAEENYDMNHSSYLYLMDAKGAYVTHFPHTVSVAELKAGILAAK